MSARLEGLLMQLGEPGRYQLIVVTLLQLNVFWYLVTIFMLSLWSYNPSHHCKLPSNSSCQLNATIPFDEVARKWDECSIYISPENHSLGTEQCSDGYVYYENAEFFSVVMEWDLMCEERYVLRIFQTVFLVGAVLGGVFGGALADKYGRKPLGLFTLYTSMILNILAGFAPHPAAFAVIKFFQGMVTQACMAASMSLKIEMLPTKFRAKVHAVGEVLAATLCVLHIVLVAYLSKNWRQAEFFNLLPMVITLGNIWILPESIRWQLKNEKQDDAMKTIRKMAKFNGIQLPSDFRKELEVIVKDIEGESEKAKNASLKDLFRKRTLALYTIIFMTNWISGTFLGMGVVLSLTSFKGSLYVNLLIMAGFVFIIKILFFITAVKIGRRITVTMAFVLAGASMLFLTLNEALFADYISNMAPWISITCGCIARGCVSSLMSISFLYVAEMFPTELRTFAQGCCSGAGRIGSMTVPMALLVGDYTYSWLPFTFFGVCGLMSGGLTQILPETRNKPMPNNVEDTKNLGKKKRDTTT